MSTGSFEQILDRDDCDRARLTRDPRYDGAFFTCVKTTKIYCRNVCLSAHDGFTVLVNTAGGLCESLIDDCRAAAGRGHPVALVAIAHNAAHRWAISPDVKVSACAHDEKGCFGELYDAEQPAVYLIRPDGHVGARWRAPRRGDVADAIEAALARAPQRVAQA